MILSNKERYHGEGIMERVSGEAIWETSWEHLGDIWGAFGRHLVARVAMGGQGGESVQNHCKN